MRAVPKDGHGAVKAILVQGDGVHIPLGENDASRPWTSWHIEGKEILALVEDDGLGRVEVLGFGIVHHPATEADDIAPDVDDGEHEPVAEAVVVAALLALEHKSGLIELFLGIPRFRQGIQQGRPSIGRIAQAEAGDGLTAHAPAQEILLGFLPGGGEELGTEKPGGLL